MRFYSVLIFATVLIGWSSSQTICPDSSVVSPCVCSDNNDGLTTQLNCFGRNVNDQKMSDILDYFLAPTTRANPLGYVNLGANPLTQVPYQLPYFRELRTIGLGSNSITNIKTKAFSYNRLCDLLDLRINSINTIAAGAFQGAFGNSSYIYLSGNSLTRVEAGVFQNVAQKMISTGGGYPNGYIWLKDNPIDCKTDPCHLAWLLHHNRNLMPAVQDAVCTDGTRFEDFDHMSLANCPIQFVCPDGDDGNFANPSSCNSYYTCIDSTPYLTQCPVDGSGNQLVYNPDIERCDSPSNVPSCNSGK